MLLRGAFTDLATLPTRFGSTRLFACHGRIRGGLDPRPRDRCDSTALLRTSTTSYEICNTTRPVSTPTSLRSPRAAGPIARRAMLQRRPACAGDRAADPTIHLRSPGCPDIRRATCVAKDRRGRRCPSRDDARGAGSPLECSSELAPRRPSEPRRIGISSALASDRPRLPLCQVPATGHGIAKTGQLSNRRDSRIASRIAPRVCLNRPPPPPPFTSYERGEPAPLEPAVRPRLTQRNRS